MDTQKKIKKFYKAPSSRGEYLKDGKTYSGEASTYAFDMGQRDEDRA